MIEWTNKKPWQGLGTEIDPNLSPHEMLIKANLDHKLPYLSPANYETFQFIKAFVEAGEAQLWAVGSLAEGRVGSLHGSLSFLLQDEGGQVRATHSVSAGLDYPGVGPEHALLK